jgi:hypothetical protein
MAIIERYINKKGKNCVQVLGVDFGSCLELIKETDKGFLCVRRGHNGWCGLGQIRYYEPKFIIFKKITDTEIEEMFGNIFNYNQKTKKEVFKKACEFFENL